MGREHNGQFAKNLERLAAVYVALLILSLLVTSCGIYAVVKLDTTSTSPGLTYATLVIGIIAVLTSLISGIAFYMEKYIVGNSAGIFILLSIILEIIMGVLIIVLQKEIVFGSLVLVGGVLSVIGFSIGLVILLLRIV
ncbi:hypothetical protein ACTXT7_009117 [Hymenolepis weldensis]